VRPCPAGTVRDARGVCQSKPTTPKQTVQRSPSPGTGAGSGAGSAATNRLPCVLPDGRQGVLNRSTGQCVPLR